MALNFSGLKGYVDLNVPLPDNCVGAKNVSTYINHLLPKLRGLGYKTVAFSTYIDDTYLASRKAKGKKKGKGEGDVQRDVPEPRIATINTAIAKEIKVLNRLTVQLSDPSLAHKLSQSENVKKYDLLSVAPVTFEAFQHCCFTLDVDIITLDPSVKNQFRFTRKMYNLAVSRGIYFELMYAPVIRESNLRKNTIFTAHVYHSIGKSKNIIVSSGAISAMELRTPYDVMNLCMLFGLSADQSKRALLSNCQAVVLRAKGRRSGKCLTEVCSVEGLGPGDKWKVEGLENDFEEMETEGL